MSKFDFLTFLCRIGVLSSMPKNGTRVLSSGVLSSGVLSQWGFVRSPCSLMGISHISKNDSQMLFAVKIVAFINK